MIGYPWGKLDRVLSNMEIAGGKQLSGRKVNYIREE